MDSQDDFIPLSNSGSSQKGQKRSRDEKSKSKSSPAAAASESASTNKGDDRPRKKTVLFVQNLPEDTTTKISILISMDRRVVFCFV